MVFWIGVVMGAVTTLLVQMIVFVIAREIRSREYRHEFAYRRDTWDRDNDN